MVSWLDTVVARFLAQEGTLGEAQLRDALRSLDAGGEGDLLADLAARSLLTPEQVETATARSRTYRTRQRQAVLLRALEARGHSRSQVHELVTLLDFAPQGAELGSLLATIAELDSEAIAELEQLAEARLRDARAQAVREARETDFATVARPLVGCAVVSERALRLSVLHRSERTSWIARCKNKLSHAHDASELFADEDEDGFDLFGLSPGQGVGDYTIQAPLGEGGMGRIYLATRPDGEFVAVKTLRAEFAEDEDHARFEREATILARIAHRSVLPLLDEGTSDAGIRYLVTPAVEGEPLNEILGRTPRLPQRQVFALADELLAALEAIHAAGVVHKDLKPENVMLRDRGQPSLLCVIDFGLAHLSGHAGADPKLFATRSSDLLGTPTYLSPEQIRGEPLSPRADLYAFGVLLFRLLTGRLPFQAKTPYAMLNAHADARPATLAAVAPDTAWDPALQELLSKLLRKDPARRPESAAVTRARLAACAARQRDVSGSSATRATA